jgi:hypothetical protein
MVGYRKVKKILEPGETVYSTGPYGGIVEAKVLEICDGWLETDFGILDFDDHGTTWWFTLKVAKENVYE